MSGKRTAQERFPEVIDAAARVFTHERYRAARMGDVAREAGVSEAALYRYVESKEGLFVLAIMHALLLAELPADEFGEHFPLKPPSLAEMICEAREFVAAEVPFGSLAAALGRSADEDPAAEFEAVMRELFALSTQTREAADMIERSARELPELAGLLNGGMRRPVLAALTEYLRSRARSGALRATPDAAVTARLVLDADLVRQAPAPGSGGSGDPRGTGADTAVDALLHAFVPHHTLGARP